MTQEFGVTTTSRFDRELKKLAAQHPGLPELFRRVISFLRVDPYGRSHQYPIRKLEAVAAGEGQYRIRAGRFRFRYDIEGQTVYLKACSLRREGTYR
jgi:mRNA-degrading endonuclease RelE of RelBE toxin-antitoxin system